MHHELTASAVLSLLYGLISSHSCRPGAPAVPGYFSFVHMDVLLVLLVWVMPRGQQRAPGSVTEGRNSVSPRALCKSSAALNPAISPDPYFRQDPLLPQSLGRWHQQPPVMAVCTMEALWRGWDVILFEGVSWHKEPNPKPRTLPTESGPSGSLENPWLPETHQRIQVGAGDAEGA